VGLAKAAEMKYIVITSKHHDGFAIFDSKADRFNIVQATPFKRDPLTRIGQHRLASLTELAITNHPRSTGTLRRTATLRST